MECIHHKPVMRIRIMPNGQVWVSTRRKITFIGPDVMGTWVHTTTNHRQLMPDGTLVSMEGETYSEHVERDGVITVDCRHVSTRAEIMVHNDGGLTALVHEVRTGIHTADDGMLLQTVFCVQECDALDLQPEGTRPTRLILGTTSRAHTYAEISPRYCPQIYTLPAKAFYD